MNHMNDTMHGMPAHMLFGWAVMAAFIVAAVLLLVFFARKSPPRNLLVSELAASKPDLIARPQPLAQAQDSPGGEGEDTIFILPDISHYTRFMTGSRFSFAHAQHIVFSLINAMITAACRTVELSKLEGDAALFYVDTRRHSADVIGQTVLDIFAAFFAERGRLKASNICPCRACRHLDDLDLKIFVHRGTAARFEFRGSVDHFGTDVILLHRIMKNNVPGHRYVMVTDAASDSIALPADLQPYPLD